MSSGKKMILLLVEIFGCQSLRSNGTGDCLVLLRLTECSVDIQSRIITSFAERRSGIGFIVSVDRSADDVVRRIESTQRDSIVTRVVQRNEIRIQIPADAD